MSEDNASVIQFLKDFQPEGPWCLTSINPDRKGVETKTFAPDTEKDLLSWLVYHNGRNNLYFHVNRVNGNLTKKAEREQIKFVDYLHVDVDPAAGKDIDAEQTRILAMFSPNGLLDRDMPPPTFLIFSGGGYQAFWKLDLPFPMDGTIPMADEVARYNKQLELLFGGDKCHNIDRLMRLPFTQNIPTEKKRKAGRVQTQARLVQSRVGKSYPIENFQKAVVTVNDGPTDYTGNVKRIDNLDELDEWRVSDSLKRIIAQGRDPDNPKLKDDSRSAWVWHVLMGLARHEVPAAVMFALLTDPQWLISESILELGRGAEKEAKRQINKAIEHAIAPELVEMNSKYFCVMVGGKFRIGTRELDPVLKRESIRYMLDSDVRKHLKVRNIQVGKDKKGNPVMLNLFDWWFDHPKRRAYEGVTFAPNQKDVPGYYNLWSGWSVDAKPGDCSLFLNHCRDVLCNGDEAQFKYLMGWMARLVQKPDEQGYVAIVLKGERGAGKSFFAHVLGSLFGRHYLPVSNSTHLVGNFNSHLREIILLFADEAFFAGDKKHESVLKTLITEATIPIEAKGIDLVIAPNMIHLIMASNDAHVVPAGPMERRYFVLNVSDSHANDRDYFKLIRDQLDEGGREALLHTLMAYDLSEFNVFDVPRTKELSVQQDLGLPPLESWWLNKLVTGALIEGEPEWRELILTATLQEDFYNEMQITKSYRGGGSRIQLGQTLNRLIPGLRTTRKDVTLQVDDGMGYLREKKLQKQYHYILPSLTECRAHWTKLYGSRPWDNL